MFCEKCGRELKGTEKFCPGCGETVLKPIYDVKDEITVKEKENKTRKPFWVICALCLTAGIIIVLIFWGKDSEVDVVEESANSESQQENALDVLEKVGNTKSQHGNGINVLEEVANSKPWQGWVQIDGLVVKPYSGIKLSDFENAGFSIENANYASVVTDEEVTLKKGDIVFQTKVIYDNSQPIKYEECEVDYIASIEISQSVDSEKNENPRIWIHDGIEIGGNIEQLTEKYSQAEYMNQQMKYELHPLSTMWERLDDSMRDVDFYMNYCVNDELEIVGYEFVNGELLSELVNNIQYEVCQFGAGTVGEPYNLNIEIPQLNDYEYNYGCMYGLCADGDKAAKIFIEDIWPKKIDVSEETPVFQGDGYEVYWLVKNTNKPEWYYIKSTDDSNFGWGIEFRLTVLDSDGNMLTSYPHRGDMVMVDWVRGKWEEYGLAPGQKNIQLGAEGLSEDDKETYAYKLVMDILNHMGVYTVEKGETAY